MDKIEYKIVHIKFNFARFFYLVYKNNEGVCVSISTSNKTVT